MRSRRLVVSLATVLVVAGCTSGEPTDRDLAGEPGQQALDAASGPAAPTVLDPPVAVASAYPPGPTDVPTGPLATEVQAELDEVVATFSTFVDLDVVERVGASGDPRVLWHLSDLLRFTQERPEGVLVLDALRAMTGVELEPGLGSWTAMTNHLLAWDLPAAPGYVAFKAGLLTQVDPTWAPFFEDADADVDWREVTWGGVRADTRPSGATEPCELSCIPALDGPAVTDAAGGSWYPDDGVVVAVAVGGEARAYPLHQLQTHELVNDVVGGVRLAVPYCTLCGSAQAYVVEGLDLLGVPEPLVLRTSGLLRRSNKVLFDLGTSSMIDTFSGRAVTGRLREAQVRLAPVTTVTTTWGEWRAAHPETTIVAQDGGTGREYDLDPLGDRDDDGPVFPIGDVDPRLPAHAAVVGVELQDGTVVAFDAAAARRSLAAGGRVTVDDVTLRRAGGGLRASLDLGDGARELAVHESFWFAWSQRHPDTRLWTTR